MRLIRHNPYLRERQLDTWNGVEDPTSDDFDQSTLSSKWTWQNQQGGSVVLNSSRLAITSRENVGSVQAILQPAPSGSWKYQAKIYPCYNQGNSGIAILSAEGTATSEEIRWFGTFNVNFHGRLYSDFTSTSSSNWGQESRISSGEMYAQLEWDGTDLDASYSDDLVTFTTLASTTLGYTPAYIGIGFVNFSSTLVYHEVDWIRRVA